MKTTTTQKIMNAIRDLHDSTPKIVAATGLAASTVRRNLSVLRESGQIVAAGQARPRGYTYSLPTPEPMPEFVTTATPEETIIATLEAPTPFGLIAARTRIKRVRLQAVLVLLVQDGKLIRERISGGWVYQRTA